MLFFTTRNGIKVDLCSLKNNKLPWHLRILQSGGYISQNEKGIYTFLPLGTTVLNRLVSLIRNALTSINAQEVIFSMLQNRGLWNQSGRVQKFGQSMKSVDSNLIMSPSHEEIACRVINPNLTYKQLPYIIFNIGHCFREEIRPKNGLLRSREFILCDGYAFSADASQHNDVYQQVKKKMVSLFDNIGLSYSTAYFSTEDEDILSEEFIVELNHIGEQRILFCLDCGNRYRASQFKNCTCGGEIKMRRGVEFADLIRNGTTYAIKTKTGFITKDGKREPYYLLSFGLGISKSLAILIEVTAEYNEFVWPVNISPFHLAIISSRNASCELNSLLPKEGIHNLDIIVDDRDLSIGRRLKEMEMLGIPYILVLQDSRYKQHELIDRIKQEKNYLASVENIMSLLRQVECQKDSATQI